MPPSLAEKGGGGFHLPTLYNPFAIRVLQIFTGFGVGCGVGIGVGRPINLGAVPGLNNIPLGSFNGVGSHVQTWIKKLGIKNLQAGIGCGVGVGHGFGLGVTLKPGAVSQLKNITEQGLSILNERMKSVTGSTENDLGEAKSTAVNEKSLPNLGIMKENTPLQTEKLLGGLLNGSSSVYPKAQSSQDAANLEVTRLQTENRVLLTLLTHQEQIEQLKKDNETLREMLTQAREPAVEKEESVLKRFETRRRSHRRC